MIDNTIYDGNLASEADPEFTDNTYGAGTNVFIGMQIRGGFARRALLQFDISQIPPGSTINSITLTIDINRAGDSALYTISVTNNDTGACPSTTFNLAVTGSDTNAESVSLMLYLTKANNVGVMIMLNRLLRDWGDGASVSI
jgi:hypothetical protein